MVKLKSIIAGTLLFILGQVSAIRLGSPVHAQVGSGVPGLSALPSSCTLANFPNVVLLSSGLYACPNGATFTLVGGGGGSGFGSTCNAFVATSAGNYTYGSTCTLGSSYVQVDLNGQIIHGGGNDYTISGNNVVLSSTAYPAVPAGWTIHIVQ